MTLAERKLLYLRRDDSCATCGRTLPAGSQAYWLKAERIVLCADCGAAEPPTSPRKSVGGASARAKHERLQRAREERHRARFGRFGGLTARLSQVPQHERAWAKGAEGEEKNARRLDKHLAKGPAVVLHDRRRPASRANIDHLAIGPAGVTVIDSKKLTGKVRVDWRGGLFSPRQYDLYVNGRRRTKLVEGVENQVEAVRLVLEEEGINVAVVGALAMADPENLPLLKHLRIRDVAIDGTRHIAQLANRPGPLDEAAIKRIALVLDRRFPPA